MLRRPIILLLSMIILSACTVPTRDKFEQNMTSYYGLNVDELVKVWGPPNAFYQSQDNMRVYQWLQGGGATFFPGTSYPYIGAQANGYGPWRNAFFPSLGLFYPNIGLAVSRPMTLDRSCTLNITANAQNIVTKHSAIGMGCVAE